MLTKCNEAQAGHRTETWVAAASAIVPGSQCCTFMPVRGHLNMMLRSMLPICARRCSIEIAGQHLRKCPERTRADTERPQVRDAGVDGGLGTDEDALGDLEPEAVG